MRLQRILLPCKPCSISRRALPVLAQTLCHVWWRWAGNWRCSSYAWSVLKALLPVLQNFHELDTPNSHSMLLLICSLSRLVVGSSRARIPQFVQNASARASLMTIEAITFCPMLHLPFISSSLPLKDQLLLRFINSLRFFTLGCGRLCDSCTTCSSGWQVQHPTWSQSSWYQLLCRFSTIVLGYAGEHQ